MIQTLFSRQRIWLLFLILLAFARLLYHLDDNTLWWDESLSLVRAEADWSKLFIGYMVVRGGIVLSISPDQHPFLYFMLLKLFTGVAGIDEFSLRFLAAACSTALVPTLWLIGRFFVRQGLAPRHTDLLATLFAAGSPFYLWYGQEVRHYAQWSLLSMITLYWLMRWFSEGEETGTEAPTPTPWQKFARYLLGFSLMFLTHYYTVLVTPIYILVMFIKYARTHVRQALILSGTIALLVAVPLYFIADRLLHLPGAAQNNTSITADVLIPDLLNSYSLGPMANLRQLAWLDGCFALLALIGIVYGLRNRDKFHNGGWILPLLLVSPPIFLLVIALFVPPYQTSRHLSTISGIFLLLVSSGLAWLWNKQRLLAAATTLLLLSGMVYTTTIYYTQPQNRSSDYRSMGQALQDHLLPSDFVLLYPLEYIRIYQYYLPIDAIDQARQTGQPVDWRIAPLPDGSLTLDDLARLTAQYRRVWFATSGPLLTADPNQELLNWSKARFVSVHETGFHSEATELKLYLFLPNVPVNTNPTFTPPHAMQTTFGQSSDAQVTLTGYELGKPLAAGFSYPITLYWQVSQRPQIKLKYILQLVKKTANGEQQIVAATEREPYEGGIPTTLWDPGRTIIEYSDLSVGVETRADDATYSLHMQVYRTDSLEKLPVQSSDGNVRIIEPDTLVLPISR